MIKSIYVKNFQSIAEQHITLSDFNVFRGESRQGKSATLRALKALVTNPRGARFIRGQEPFCLVAVETEKGIVAWKKERAGSASYTIQEIGKDKQVFSPATEIPEQVSSVLNITDFIVDDFGKLSLNFSPQMEPPFLLPSPNVWSPANIAKVLGSVSSIHRVTKALKLCSVDIHSDKTELTREERETSDLELRLSRLPSKETIESTLSRIADLQKEIDNLKLVVDAEDVARAEALESEIKAQSVEFKKLKDIPELPDLFSKCVELDGMLSVLHDVAFKEQDIKSEASQLEQVKKDLSLAEEELDKFMKENPTCPLCGSEWRGEHEH